jgi:transposase
MFDIVDARKERGKALSRDRRIRRVEGSLWFVPSQTNNAGGYLVNVLAATCSCPDHEERRTKCKHQWAVEFSQVVEVQPDGSATVREAVTVTRKTYPQDWPAYNAAQCEEKERVQALLRALCDVSGRRATTDIEACERAGHMAHAPRYNTTFDYFAKSELTPLLTTLIEESAAPLACVESRFAVDSTGFGTATYRRWYDHKYGREMKEHGWVKAHAMVGTTTNVITAIRVTDSDANDSPELPALVASTGQRFALAEVSADKAYLSNKNLAAIEAVGAVPYIPFKVNSKGDGSAAWRRMFGLFMYKQAEFLAAYHQRSNVEATFSALKRKFGGSVRSKTPTAQVNEVLCKALCFNLSMLVHAIHELGIEPAFGAAS